MILGTGTNDVIYTKEISSIEDEIENILEFIQSGEVVLIADNIEDIEDRFDGVFSVE